MKAATWNFLRRISRFHVAVAFLFFIAICTPLAAQELLTPHSVAQIRTVGEVAISPDGARVAYVLRIPRDPSTEPDGPEWNELHVVDQAGKDATLVAKWASLSGPIWSKDGATIFFLGRSPSVQRNSVFSMGASGGEVRPVVAHPTSIQRFALAPDEKSIAFLATEETPAAKADLRRKGFNQEIYEEDRPFVRVWITDTAGSSPRKLELAGSASALRWGPESGRLVVALAPTPLIDDEYMNRKVRVVEVASGNVAAEIHTTGKFGDFDWSPDGKTIAVISAADRNDPQEGRLMVAAATGGALRDLLPGLKGHVSAIAWQDADTVMYIADEGVWTTFGKVRRDGSGQKTIASPGGAILTALSLSADGQSGAFLGQTPSHPAEVFAMKHGETAPRQLTDSNPWLSSVRMGKQEIVRYKARDGLEVEGLLIRPLDEVKDRRFPLILTVHGGPESHYRNGWLTSYSSPGQMAAAGGYFVFYPNYRGSTGRGVAFSKLDQADAAGKEFDDLVDGVDHLIALGLVDKSKVGITGGSYGGYATAWGVTFYSDRYAAGVMFVGISDKISKWGTTDIAQEETLVHALHLPWENWQKFLERSPIYHAGKARTPTLILGGTDDPRVHPGQSLELYRHLKARSKAPVRLVRYPGEPHGNRRAASRLDYSLRMMQWMDHYLKGPGDAPPPYEIDYAPSK